MSYTNDIRRNPDYLSYHQSINAELKATKDRVRYFIGDSHWGEDGRFKEILLINHLKKVLPSNVSVGTGFVRNGEKITSQIDLIIYDNSIPTLFLEGDFVIVLPESVYGIIEVKSKIRANEEFIRAVNKAHLNGEKIQKKIFNGIFGFENQISFSGDMLAPSIHQILVNNSGYLNHVCFGSDIFMKYWKGGNPQDNDNKECFSFYKLSNLSFGYFISNLIEFIHLNSRGSVISEEFENFLYPIEEGKESRRLQNFEMKL
ncbi:hypothetical protein BMG_6111 (plasmid) [Priestia megaterium]|uniref:DUF6602 domain-containing protein n=1 Tax=Priestia megaterium TaxID=1404 RepID=UPI0015DCE3E9|nr:DUF6602 domain-containing protein [Priestia megaterium]QLK09339.1 hypothetical protein BMG_6111 [Priestia megaterium]